MVDLAHAGRIHLSGSMPVASNSTADWLADLRRRDIKPPAAAETFLAEALTGPALKSVKEAIESHAVRARALDAALTVLGLDRRADSALCGAFDAGEPIQGFTTAARIARELALMCWLHTYTDYDTVLEEEVQSLREDAGRYYSGIYADARDYAKDRFTPPAAWPWLT